MTKVQDKPTVAAATTSSAVADEIVTQLCNGLSAAQLARLAEAGKCSYSPEEFRAQLPAARRKLTLAAQYDRDEELGRAISRLEELYRRAMTRVAIEPGMLLPDLRAALLAQKELNRLLGLRGADPSAPDPEKNQSEKARKRDQNAESIFDAVDAHLEPLGLSSDEKDHYSDLIRLAGSEIRRLRKAAKRKTKEAKDGPSAKKKNPPAA